MLLWIIYFCSLLNLFLFAYWMPTVLNMIGMTPAQAVFASSLRDGGAIFVVLYLGLAIDRIGPERTLALHYALGAVFIAAIALVALPYAAALRRQRVGRDDDHRQPDRAQRDLRQTLSGAHAHQRSRLGAWHRPAWRDRRAGHWAVICCRSASRRRSIFLSRLRVRADRGDWPPRCWRFAAVRVEVSATEEAAS